MGVRSSITNGIRLFDLLQEYENITDSEGLVIQALETLEDYDFISDVDSDETALMRTVLKYIKVNYGGVVSFNPIIPEELDIVFECCGEQDALDTAINVLKPGGKLVIVGIPIEDNSFFIQGIQCLS